MTNMPKTNSCLLQNDIYFPMKGKLTNILLDIMKFAYNRLFFAGSTYLLFYCNSIISGYDTKLCHGVETKKKMLGLTQFSLSVYLSVTEL